MNTHIFCFEQKIKNGDGGCGGWGVGGGVINLQEEKIKTSKLYLQPT